MHTVLIVLALLAAVIAALIGFEVFTDEHALGWLAASLAFFYASHLVVDR